MLLVALADGRNGQPPVAQPLRLPMLPRPALGPALLWAALPAVAQLVVGIVASSLAAVAFVLVTHRPDDLPGFLQDFDHFLVPLGTLTTLALALLVTQIMFSGQVQRVLGWRNATWQQWMGTLLLVVPLAVLASEAGNCAAECMCLFESSWLDRYRASNSELYGRFVHESWCMVFLAGCLVPGIGEEIYCRGFLSRGLVARHGWLVGSLWASFLFGAMHLDPVQACSAFVLGLGLQYVFLTTGSLLAPITLHTLNNAAAFAALRYQHLFPVPGLTVGGDHVVHTPFPLTLAAAFSLAAVAVLLFSTRTRWLLPDGSAWSPGYVTAECPPKALVARPVSMVPPCSLWLVTLAAFVVLAAAVVAANGSIANWP